MRVILATDPSAIANAVEALRVGGIVAHATETCYGLACDLTNADAVQKLFGIKRRPTNQPVSALFDSIASAKKFVEWNDSAEELAKKHLPGPLTIILPALPDTTPLYVTADGKRAAEIGIRISPHSVAMALAKAFGRPIATTSANVHGKKNPYSAGDIQEQFRSTLMPDCILDGGRLPQAPPSTVVRAIGDDFSVVRQGGISL